MTAFFRPTSVGLAMVQALAKAPRVQKAEVRGFHEDWVQRRVALNCDRDGVGIVKETERVGLSFRTAKQLRESGVIS